MADRDVKVKLSIEAAGEQATQQMKALATQANQATASVKQLNAEQAKLKQGAGGGAGVAGAGTPGQQLRGSVGPVGDPFGSVKQVEQQRQAASVRPSYNVTPPGAAVPQVQQPAKSPDVKQLATDAKTPVADAKDGTKVATRGLAGQVGIAQDLLQGAAAVLTVIKGVSAALSVTAKGIDALGDSSLSTGQAIRKVGESIPIIGELLKSVGELADAVSGKSESIRRAGREQVVSAAQTATSLSTYQQSAPLNQQINQLTANAAAFGGPPVQFRPPAQDSYQNELAYSQYERKAPLEVAKSQADAEAKASREIADEATIKRKALQEQISPAETAVSAQEEKFKNASADAEKKKNETLQNPIIKTLNNLAPIGGYFNTSLTSSTADKGKIDAASQLQQALDKEKVIRGQLLTATQQEAAAAQAAAQAESKARQAAIAIAKDELAVLKEKEAQIKQASQAFGSLTAIDKQSALESAQQFKSGGYDTLTPEQKQALTAAGFGQQLNFAAQQSAQNDSAFKQISALFGQDSDLGEVRKKITELNADIQVAVQIDTKDLAQQLKDTLVPALKEAIEQIAKLAAIEVKKIKVGQDQANAGQ